MSVKIDIVAQSAMDRYYGGYKSSQDHWEIGDFIWACGFAWGTVAQKMYQMMYAELRSEKTDGLVSFDPLLLAEQELTVERDRETGKMFAKFTDPIMSFGFSDQSVGVQMVTVTEPAASFGDELERYSKQSSWQLSLLPFVNKIFFSPSKLGITIVKKGFCNVSKVSVSYLPAAGSKEILVPEGMVDEIIAEAITLIREGKIPVIKKTLDQNPNAVMEGEINKEALR